MPDTAPPADHAGPPALAALLRAADELEREAHECAREEAFDASHDGWAGHGPDFWRGLATLVRTLVAEYEAMETAIVDCKDPSLVTGYRNQLAAYGRALDALAACFIRSANAT